MGQSNTKQQQESLSAPAIQPNQATTESKPTEQKLKPCCACPETRKLRDECIIEKGEAKCTELIEQHKECLRKLGFNV